MQLGISSFTFGWAVGVSGFEAPAAPMGAFDLLDKARELGVSLVQFGDNLPLHDLRDEELHELSRRAKNEDIALEVGARGLKAPHLARYIEIAHLLDARILRFVIDQNEFEPLPAQVVTTLRAALPSLQNLRIGIENHDRFAARTLRELIENVGDERVGICLDTANSLGAGEGLREVVPLLAPHTLNWHIKDYHIARLPYLMGFCIEGRPAGSGDLDLNFVWDLLQQGRCGSAVVELWTPPERAMAQTIEKEARWATQSLQFLRKWREWH